MRATSRAYLSSSHACWHGLRQSPMSPQTHPGWLVEGTRFSTQRLTRKRLRKASSNCLARGSGLKRAIEDGSAACQSSGHTGPGEAVSHQDLDKGQRSQLQVLPDVPGQVAAREVVEQDARFERRARRPVADAPGDVPQRQPARKAIPRHKQAPQAPAQVRRLAHVGASVLEVDSEDAGSRRDCEQRRLVVPVGNFCESHCLRRTVPARVCQRASSGDRRGDARRPRPDRRVGALTSPSQLRRRRLGRPGRRGPERGPARKPLAGRRPSALSHGAATWLPRTPPVFSLRGRSMIPFRPSGLRLARHPVDLPVAALRVVQPSPGGLVPVGDAGRA